MHLDRALLRPAANLDGGTGTVQYRRALDPGVFFTTRAGTFGGEDSAQYMILSKKLKPAQPSCL